MAEAPSSNFFKDLSLESLTNNFFLSGIGLWRLKLIGEDVEQAQVAVNRSFLSLLGDKRTPEEGLAPVSIRNFLEIWLHPEEYAQFLGGLDALIQGGIDHYDLEHRLYSHILGQWRWFSLHCDVFEQHQGLGSVTVDGVVLDIHNNHLARHALVEALQAKAQTSRALELEQNRLAAVIDAAELGVWDCDIPTGLVSYSSGWANTIGGQVSELGQTLWDRKNFVFPGDLEKAEKAFRDHLQGLTPMYTADYRLRHRDGSVVWAQDRGRVVEFDEEGRPKRLLGVMINVTRQKLIEQDLFSSKEKMELFFRAASIGTWDLDLISGHVDYNDIFYQLLGYKPDDLKNTLAEWEELVHPDDLPAVMAGMEMVINGQTIVYSSEVRLKHKNGNYIWTYDVGRVVEWDRQGQAVRMVGGHLDFTQQKRMEEDIYKMIERERDSRMAKELAEESARAKSEFLANMSHEIRTPMNAILGLTHLVLQTQLNEQQTEYLQRTSIAAQALLRIINDILDFSKIEAGKLEMEMTDFRLEGLLNSSMKLLSNSAANKKLEFTCETDPELPGFFLGDQVRLGQILNNLLSNAIKFTEHGYVRLKARLIEKTAEEAVLEFSVADSGIGLSEEQSGILFNAFSQADTSITRKYGGTGLGLTISKRLCEIMGGRIWVQSTLGQGSTFFFTVRLKTADEPKAQAKGGAVSFKGLTALVIDDDSTALEIISEELSRESFEVVTCTGGQEALNYLEERDWFPDLLVVDWQMPGLDGLETIRSLQKKWSNSRQIPILMVTAYSRDEVLPLSRSLGVNKVLDKPVSSSKLHDTLMEVFGSRLSRSEKDSLASEKEMIKTIRGARILLVEDNDVNQLVAGRILGNAGLQVTIAGNGAAAVDLVREQAFDLILMDIQMPVMDGFTATGHIREMGLDLPIVAMTAHAMSSDRELSLKSGMNDHINKPINVQELFQTLLKWIPPREKTDGPEPAAVPS